MPTNLKNVARLSASQVLICDLNSSLPGIKSIYKIVEDLLTSRFIFLSFDFALHNFRRSFFKIFAFRNKAEFSA
ncbi:hypothetical protein L596_020070 [Steinernema carpocapsae]|uniref:Uncharacterized protein n=1 Tax=Steinernema carpocapsae TaxID=34508 RepID=A0A4V6A0T4_STECR|nr:hypothetical protein L596_020070 [Steinernema carpocapsae]